MSCNKNIDKSRDSKTVLGNCTSKKVEHTPKIAPERKKIKFFKPRKTILVRELKLYHVFKSQNLERGAFDTAFELEGKVLHAHKLILTHASEVMGVMLSSRWTSKGEIIEIGSYSYNVFYQFLCFLYSGKCEITRHNIHQLTDLAECYNVVCLKNFCDKFLAKMKNNVKTVEEMVEFGVRYSLKKFKTSLRAFIRKRFDDLIVDDSFIAREKTFVEFSSNAYPFKYREDYCRAVYNWAEQKTLMQPNDLITENDLHEAIVTELKAILPNIDFSSMSYDFLMSFVVEKGFCLTPVQLRDYFLRHHRHLNKHYQEYVLELVYYLARRQASMKQTMYPHHNFNLVDSIRKDLALVIPEVKFFEMNKKFLNNIVVGNGILTEEEASHVCDTRVTIVSDGKTITGSIQDNRKNYNIIHKLNNKEYYAKAQNNKKVRFTYFKYSLKALPQTITKMKGVDWYLCVEKDGILTFKHHTLVGRRDILLAEMKSNSEFEIDPRNFCCLTAKYNNV